MTNRRRVGVDSVPFGAVVLRSSVDVAVRSLQRSAGSVISVWSCWPAAARRCGPQCTRCVEHRTWVCVLARARRSLVAACRSLAPRPVRPTLTSSSATLRRRLTGWARRAALPARSAVREPPPRILLPCSLLRLAEEFRRLGRELVTLPAKTLNRMALPSDLMEAVEEVTASSTASTGDSRTPQHMRIESRRGVGSTKKGRARVEALMAQCVSFRGLCCAPLTRARGPTYPGSCAATSPRAPHASKLPRDWHLRVRSLPR